ncbi:tRNA (adenine(22)-N(1))-methyltransferase [Ornithinibacillus scapharcae]|uniref:tRNA (adenine(22)-N(1))-methyltransferase n=1 Tax=Ornithinibacillus scapharcae TaxID=1147159 RepID=UPI000225B396|nr:class I SAM-dependent methyltransferase [Ornithinibacillus scapharcae]
MTEDIKLSKRLLQVASYLPLGATFADIGSDHAYLPCYVCKRDQTARAIAGEVNEGPYNSALETVTKYELNNVIDVRLGDGLAVLRQDEVNQVVIAGMGGSLIRSILESGKDKLQHAELIIAQPNVDESNVRSWFIDNFYEITNEVILEENGHIYEIIVGRKVNDLVKLTEQELLFGPILLENRDTIFYQKWKSEREKLERVINQMRKAKVQHEEKIASFTRQLEWIEEVLSNGSKDS